MKCAYSCVDLDFGALCAGLVAVNMALAQGAQRLQIQGERTSGQDVRTQNVTAVTAIANIVKTSLGPVGLDKVMQCFGCAHDMAGCCRMHAIQRSACMYTCYTLTSTANHSL